MLPKRIIVLDTETISIDKPYIYDLGFIVAELDENLKYQVIYQSQQVIQQIYDNKALFATAYYESKRKIYTSMMKGRKAKKIKYGFALRNLMLVAEQFEVNDILAYNSPFDKRALNFTTNFFKLKNELDNKNWLDIHAIANNYIHKHKEYIEYATNLEWFNTSGYLQTNAEKTFAFLTNNKDFKEEHTSLQDCLIELDILNSCIEKGFDNSEEMKTSFVKAETKQTLKIKIDDKVYDFEYSKRINHKNGDITLKK